VQKTSEKRDFRTFVNLPRTVAEGRSGARTNRTYKVALTRRARYLFSRSSSFVCCCCLIEISLWYVPPRDPSLGLLYFVALVGVVVVDHVAVGV